MFGADVRAARESVFGRRRVSVRSALIPAWWDCWEAEKLMCVMFFSLVFSSGPGGGVEDQCINAHRYRYEDACPAQAFAIGALPVLNGR